MPRSSAAWQLSQAVGACPAADRVQSAYAGLPVAGLPGISSGVCRNGQPDTFAGFAYRVLCAGSFRIRWSLVTGRHSGQVSVFRYIECQSRARWGGAAAEVAVTADVLITVLPGTRELHDMMLMPGGVLAALPRAATWIDMTSTAPATGRVLAHAALASGVGMLDAPAG
ncbi:MAG: NAD(P)-binding domain-containing protein, partial [Candidatus Acidiferrales bacterium]